MFDITYSKHNKDMKCPICGKTLIESKTYAVVSCQNLDYKFNKTIDWERAGFSPLHSLVYSYVTVKEIINKKEM